MTSQEPSRKPWRFHQYAFSQIRPPSLESLVSRQLSSLEYDTHGPPQVRNERGPLAKRLAPTSRVPGGDGWRRSDAQEGISEDTFAGARPAAPRFFPCLTAGWAADPAQGRTALLRLVRPPQRPTTARRFSRSAVGTPCSGKHFWKNLEPKHFSTKPFRNPDHFQSRLTLKPDTLNPLFEFVPQSFETKVFWKPPGSKILWEKTN